MKNKILLIIFYIIFIINSNLLSDENNKTLKVGLLAPLSGPYSEIGNSLLYSLQLALEEINDKNVTIIPRDSGFNNKEKLSAAIKDMRSSGVKIIIGPTTYKEFDDVKKYNDLIFISPSNVDPEFSNNIISIGVSLESQLVALTEFIKSQKKTKTIIMYPNNQYLSLIEKKPSVILFYRGGWCPYCNYELRAFEEVLERIEDLGAQLVAVSPETPDDSLTTKDKNELSYAVLSDVGNNVTNDYGLVFSLDERLRPIYDQSGVDLPAFNGDNTFNLPMPATYVINQSGQIVYAFVSEDYTKRSEPSEVVKILTTLDN